MSKYEIKNAQGEKVAEADLADGVFGIEPNVHVMHHIVKCQMSNWRAGTHSTKGRSDVSGGGKKPYRQKGTGRARQGSIRAAQWRGGGVVFGPTPHLHTKRMNNKEVKLAMRSALSGKARENELVLVDDFGFEKPCTKDAVKFVDALGLGGKRITVVLTEDDIDTALSFRNLPQVTVLFDHEIDTYFMLDNKALVLAEPVATRLGEVLA